MALIDKLRADPAYEYIDPTGQSDAYLKKRLPDGQLIQVVPLAFSRARIVISGHNPRNKLDGSWTDGF